MILVLLGIVFINFQLMITSMRSSTDIGVLLCLIFIYFIATIANRKQGTMKWTGFTRLPLLVAWIIFGLAQSALIALSGTLFAFIYTKLRQKKHFRGDWKSDLHLIGNNGASLFSVHLVYTLLDGRFPQITASSAYADINILLVALVVGSLASISLIMLTEGFSLRDILADTDKYLVPEILVSLVGIILPVIFVRVNIFIFALSILLIALQIFRSARVRQSEDSLKRRLREMSILNQLGVTITSELSLSTAMDAVYTELNRLFDATTIYIALYDEEQHVLDFQLVMVNGEKQDWETHPLQNDLLAYAINEKQSLHVTREESRRLVKHAFDGQLLDAEHLMIAPLKVGTKVFGLLGASNATNPEAFSEHDFELFQTISTQAGLAIRNALLYDRTVHLADNLSIINQSLQGMIFNLDRANSLKTACQIAVDIMSASKAAIFLLEPDLDNQLKRADSIGFDDVDYVETVTYQPTLFVDGARIISDVRKTSHQDIVDLAKVGAFRACVQIPLRSGNTLVGTLEVYHDEPYHYDDSEINLLEMLTNQITAALDNADLLQALELYATEQAQLVHLSRIAGGTLNLDKIIYDVCDLLAHIMQVERVEIGLWQADHQHLRLYSHAEGKSELASVDIALDSIAEIPDILRTRGLSTLSVFHSDDLRSDALQNYMAQHHDATVAMMPMFLEDEVLGLIILGDSTPHHFNENDQRLLEMASHQITVQIHNARVHQQTQRELALGLEQLGLIEDITQQISQALDLDIIIQNVLDAALQTTGADLVSVSLPDDKNTTLFNMIWREVVDNRIVQNNIMFELEGGVVGHVMRTGEAILVPDNSEFDDYVHPEGALKTYNSSLAVPLISADKVIGVLNLESMRPNFFTEAQANFIKSLAGHTAISITNAHLLNARENQINVLTWLRGLSLDALSLIRPHEIYNSILQTALILLDAHEVILYHYDESETDVQLLESLTIRDNHIVSFQPTIPNSIIQDVIQTNSIKLIEDIHQAGLDEHEDLQDLSYESLIIIPIVRRQAVQEILCIGFSEGRYFSQDDLNTVELLSAQVASHIENAALNTEITNSHDRMRAILDSTRDGMILLDNDQRIQDANSAANELIGVDLHAHLFEPIDKLIDLSDDQEQRAEVWQGIVKDYQKSPDAIHNQDYVFEHHESLIHVKTLVTEVQDETEKTVGRLLILRDVTEEKSLQDFHETMQSMVLHDLRGPLTAIVTSMYVAENILTLYDGSEFDELEDALKKTFGVSLKSAEDLLRQVDTLRDLPMINQMNVEPQHISAYDVAQSAYSSLSANFIEANISIGIDIHKSKTVFADESLVQRVIVNLLHNAYKFTPVDGTVLIRMIEASEEGYFCIQIADNGPGIPENQRERIFGQFVQIEGHKPRAGGKGTGLGLNFCKLAIEAHGGRIWVEANGPLSGACFAFTLPKADWRNSL